MYSVWPSSPSTGVGSGCSTSPGTNRKSVGLVSQKNAGDFDAWPNIARGRGCCGKIVPEGSSSPGRRCIGRVRAISSRCDPSVYIGWGVRSFASWAIFLWIPHEWIFHVTKEMVETYRFLVFSQCDEFRTSSDSSRRQRISRQYQPGDLLWRYNIITERLVSFCGSPRFTSKVFREQLYSRVRRRL